MNKAKMYAENMKTLDSQSQARFQPASIKKRIFHNQRKTKDPASGKWN